MKAKSGNSVSAYARVGGAKGSPQCSRAESESGGVSRFSGGETRESGPLFCFPSSSFELQSSGDLVVSGIGRKSACDTGKGLRFGSWDAGATRTVRRGENTARSAVVKRCALSRCSSFVFMLSLDSGANAPVFSFEL